MRLNNGLAFLVLVAVLLPLSGVSSAVDVFSDFASFDAATNTVVVEDFEAVTPKDTALASFTSNGITYTGTQNPAVVAPNVWVAGAGYTNFGIPEPTTSAILTSTGYESFLIDLSSTPATAVGFDVYLNSDGVGTWYFGQMGNALAVTVDTRYPGSVHFLGFLFDEPVYKILWESAVVTNQQVNTGLDNLRLGTAAPTIPAPGAILLGTLGTSLLGWFRRRWTL